MNPNTTLSPGCLPNKKIPTLIPKYSQTGYNANIRIPQSIKIRWGPGTQSSCRLLKSIL